MGRIVFPTFLDLFYEVLKIQGPHPPTPNRSPPEYAYAHVTNVFNKVHKKGLKEYTEVKIKIKL